MKNTFLVLFCLISIALFSSNNKIDKLKEAKAREWLNNQPLEFFENKGQFIDAAGKPAENVLFKTSFGNCDIYITNKGLSYVFLKQEETNDCLKAKNDIYSFREKKKAGKKVMYYRLDMNLEGATIANANIIKEEEGAQGVNNYFYAHCPQGIYGVKGYEKITIKNIYKGIDWVIYSNGNSKKHPLKYDFVVHPQADYKDIKIRFLNAQSTSLAENDTKLKIQTIAGNIEEGNLLSYLPDNTEKQGIESKYVENKDQLIAFEIGDYDKTKTLIIDPLVWATYYGGSGTDEFNSIGIDSQDNIYITGLTYASPDFPTQQLPGAYWQETNAGGEDEDAFILKFNSQGVRQWATYYGGTGSDIFYSVCLDSQDNIVLSGCTTSPDFPTQQLEGAYWQTGNPVAWDICVVKFNNQGVRLWATYYSGSGNDYGRSMCIDSQDNVYITGETDSHDLPLKQLTGAYWQPDNTSPGSSDSYIIRFNNQGALVWATYYGSSNEDRGYCIRTDSQDNVYMTGFTYATDFPVQQLPGAYWQGTNGGNTDAFLLKFNNQGVRQWATYYGGTSHEIGYAIGIDKEDNVYFSGTTSSIDFPVQQSNEAFWQANNAGGDDVFILKFNNQGVRQWATYYGGSGDDYGYSIHENGQNSIYFTGMTTSSDFPTQELTGEYFQPNCNGSRDVFMMEFDNQCSRQWATYYGSDGWDYGNDIAVDSQDFIYFIGTAWGSDAYTLDPLNGAYYDSSFNGVRNGYIFKISSRTPSYPSGISNDMSDENNCLSSPIPNPAYRYTRIDYKLPENVSYGEIVFYDVLGTEVNRFKVNHGTSKITLNTGNFKPGSYYYNLQIPGKTTGGKKLVVLK
jgi:hypothetical protein